MKSKRRMSETKIVSSALIVVFVCFSLLGCRLCKFTSFLKSEGQLLSLVAGLGSRRRNAPVGILLLML